MHTFIGTPYARGAQHGSELATAIRTRVRRSLPVDLDTARMTALAQPWIDETEDLDSDIVREMAGIAAGSGTTLAEVTLLNSFEAFNFADMVEREGCTAVGVAAKGGTLLAQNWDANSQLGGGLSVHLHRDPEAADVAVLASPGGLGWIGMNECGLGLVNNDLLGGPTASTAPSQVIRRILLKHADTSLALAAARAMGHPALRSYMLADSAGKLASIEVLPHHQPATVAVSSAGMVHANHALTRSAQGVEDREMQESVYPSSAHRARRAVDLLERSRDEDDQHARVRRVLGDHDGLPLSICRHPSPAEETSTAASVVFDCTRRRAEFSLGLACTPHAREVVAFSVTTAVTDMPTI
jgi:isopenicillin-N N-acyltransferase like protein